MISVISCVFPSQISCHIQLYSDCAKKRSLAESLNFIFIIVVAFTFDQWETQKNEMNMANDDDHECKVTLECEFNVGFIINVKSKRYLINQ